MGWDPVPYMIGNGAIHSEAVMRCVAYSALNGNEGVGGPNDLKVSQLSTPGSGVSVGVGSCSVLGRGTAQVAEMYVGRMLSAETKTIASTGASSGRSDLIVARIEDPNLPGSQWNQPTDSTIGPYIFTRIISGVPSSTTTVTELNLGYTAIPLARVDIPTNTTVITQGMIVDLRKVANPRRERRLYTVNPSATAKLNSTSFADWFGTWQVPVPSWATRAVLVALASGVRHARASSSTAGTTAGQVRAALGTVYTQYTQYNLETSTNDSTSRQVLAAGDTISIPSTMRGTVQSLRLQGLQTSGNVPLDVDTSTFATVDVEFQEFAV